MEQFLCYYDLFGISDEEIDEEAFLALSPALVESIFPKIGTRAKFLNRLSLLKLASKVSSYCVIFACKSDVFAIQFSDCMPKYMWKPVQTTYLCFSW